MKIILATNNKGKIAEMKQKLSTYSIDVISQKDAGLDIEIEETGETFEENAVLKAEVVYKETGSAVIADDSGLMIDALDGQPGVFSHRFVGPNATDEDRINKILDLMNGIPESKRTARFKCVICYIDNNGKKNIFEGTVEGKIGFEPRGNNGFGYDPIFVLANGKTFAEITAEEKNQISHRGKAISELMEYIKNDFFIHKSSV